LCEILDKLKRPESGVRRDATPISPILLKLRSSDRFDKLMRPVSEVFKDANPIFVILL